jgi:hypothetical protein
MLILIIEYCKIHKHNNGMMPFEVMDSDAQLVDVDPKTLLDLATSACYMKIDSHEKLTWSKVGELIKGNTNTRGNCPNLWCCR